MYDLYCKFDKNFEVGGHMSYQSYVKMGSHAKLSPQLLSSPDYLYVYKTIMRNKIDLEKGLNQSANKQIDSARIDFKEFLEALVKIASIAKNELGGLKDNTQEIEANRQTNSHRDKEVEFNYENMTAETLVNLFKYLKLQPANKSGKQKQRDESQSKVDGMDNQVEQ